jgi:hypothetical protein
LDAAQTLALRALLDKKAGENSGNAHVYSANFHPIKPAVFPNSNDTMLIWQFVDPSDARFRYCLMRAARWLV